MSEGRVPAGTPEELSLELEKLLHRGRSDSVVISLRINRRLLELLDEKIESLRARGVRVTRSDIINRLILEFVKAPCRILDDNILEIRIDRVEVAPNHRYNRRAGVVHHTTLHHTTPELGKKVEPPPPDLIRRINKALEKAKWMSREQKVELLEPLLEELQKYRESPLGQFYIAAIESELSR